MHLDVDALCAMRWTNRCNQKQLSSSLQPVFLFLSPWRTSSAPVTDICEVSWPINLSLRHPSVFSSPKWPPTVPACGSCKISLQISWGTICCKCPPLPKLFVSWAHHWHSFVMLWYYWCQLNCIKNIIILVMFIYKAEIIKLKVKVVV